MDGNPLTGQIEQPAGFDHLQPFIHHRCRIDTYFAAHTPIGVIQSIGKSHMFQCLEGVTEKWSP